MIRAIPCEIRGVPIRENGAVGIRFVSGEHCVSVGNGDFVEISAEKTSMKRIFSSSDYTITAYYFRGGLSGMTDCDTAFIALSEGGKLKINDETTTFGSRSVLDLTAVTGKYVLEMPVYTHVLKIEFTEEL